MAVRSRRNSYIGRKAIYKGEADNGTESKYGTLTDYVDRAMKHATYDKLEAGTFVGRVPPCKGVSAFGATLSECEDELRSTLEDWIFVGSNSGGWRLSKSS